MKYSVIWAHEALAKLADFWLNAEERNEIEQSANEIDRCLATDPQNCGESRSSETRILFHEALIVVFRVFAEDLRVVVQDVRLNRHRQ